MNRPKITKQVERTPVADKLILEMFRDIHGRFPNDLDCNPSDVQTYLKQKYKINVPLGDARGVLRFIRAVDDKIMDTVHRTKRKLRRGKG